MKLESKISAKAVLGGKAAILGLFTVVTEGDKGTKDYREIRQPNPDAGFDLVGVARKKEKVETDYGDSVRFVGNFKAVNRLTGEEHRSAKLFLPDIASDMLSNIMDEHPDSSVEFGFRIGVKPADTATGYEYTVEPLMAKSESDPLDALQQRMMAALPSPGDNVVAQVKPDTADTRKKK